MLVPNRHDSFDSNYRYGFQGQEKDDEVKGEGNSINYEFRMHDPRVGRFFAVDPLTKKYPFYSPYQFSGNRVVDMVELEGLEPSQNPKPAGGEEVQAAAGVKAIQKGAQLNDLLQNGIDYANPLDKPETGLNGTYSCSKDGDYISDTDESAAKKYNMFVFNGSKYRVDESNADTYHNYESMVVATILTNFVTGTGPENYEFPTNGVISSKFWDSDIVQNALEKFSEGAHPNGATIQYNFGGRELLKDAVKNQNIFTITGLVGSGNITITKTAKEIHIRIFNITSLTSGDFVKTQSDESSWAKSYVREPDKRTPYGNVSQTFNLSIPLK